MRIRLESVKSIGKKTGINDDKGYIVAIALALIIIASLLAGYYVLFKPAPEGYSTIYLLDAQNKAENYPQLLVANQNSTFTVPVTVINNMGWTVQYQVLVKITNNLDSSPVNTQPTAAYNATLANGQTWQKIATITENQVGNYWVVFELYKFNPANGGSYQYTYDYCVLPIQVVS
ncbi:MAG: DUF1616 domain-containing protein [Candidatus Bathyarchaeia archaeon]|jgi:uncharacterized membrane protein